MLNEGQPLTRTIDVNATGVDFNIFLIDQQGTRTELVDFRELYFGQKREISGFLVNNTPHDVDFKVQMKLGDYKLHMEDAKLQTPIEQGFEMTEQIMKCTPLKGTIKSYSQIPVSFTCKSKVFPQNIESVKKYAFTEKKQEAKNNPYGEKETQRTEDFFYTAIINFDKIDEEPTIIQLVAKGVMRGKRDHKFISLTQKIPPSFRKITEKNISPNSSLPDPH